MSSHENTMQSMDGDDINSYPHNIVKSMMFAYGDSDIPLVSCQQFMAELSKSGFDGSIINLVYHQLQKIIADAKALAKSRKRITIGYTEMLFQFRRHPIFIRRLIQYTRIHEVAPKLLNSAAEEFDLGDHNEIQSTSYPLDEKLNKGKTLFDAIKEIDVTGELVALFDLATIPDEQKVERMRRLAARTEKMDAETYEHFSYARMMSFCSKKGKKSMSLSKRFIEWLGSPKLDHGVVYVLNYCATEIVALIVDSAVLVKEQEAKIFKDECPGKTLQRRHYEEALRRNLGYSRNKNVLFGYF